MRLLIYEPDHRGHHFVHLARVLPDISELVEKVTLATTPSAAQSPQFQVHLGAYAHLFTVDTSIGENVPAPGLKHAIRGYKQLRDLTQRLNPDHVFVPYGDGIAQVVGLARLAGKHAWSRATEAEVLLMRGGYQYPAENYRRKVANRVSPQTIAWGPWSRIHHMNPDDLAVLETYESAQRGRFRLMPDPVEPPSMATKAEARRELGIAPSGRYIGCAGGIDRRKGIHLLVRAFLASQGSLASDDRLLLAGPVDKEIRLLLEQEAARALQDGRIVLIDRPLTSLEFPLAFRAMDVVATPYPSFAHSASIVIHAAASGRPVLGSAIGWMDRTVRDFQLGVTCDVRNPDALSSALIEMLAASGTFQSSESSHRFVAFHGVENFCAHWTVRLRERLGLPADENLIHWDSVFVDGHAGEGRKDPAPVATEASAGR